ncbi:hypothetical protein AB1Y20_015207 [Prymnesium parvum]|uniref:tRNA/rRNA methyltransferase SpoU type domain-containing protein n=1 Tax=Prymnesium parvum TaxID=97485 RepID=A0AB34JZW6_PRYPA
MLWGCDDPEEGTLHAQWDSTEVKQEAHDALVRALEEARARAREASRASREEPNDSPGVVQASDYGSAPLDSLFENLRAFSLHQAVGGGADLKLYDAMQNPDRLLAKHGYFVAEGCLVVQQVLSLPSYFPASILSTEPTLRKLMPDLCASDARLRAAGRDNATPEMNLVEAAEGSAAVSAPLNCCVYVGSRGDISRITGFKHSALATLAIVQRPLGVHRPVADWLPKLRPMGGAPTGPPVVLIMDNVIKPDNVGALFRTALAFGVSGILLSPKCADPLYRKAIRASMGAVFKIPYLYASSNWPVELIALSSRGYRTLALHLLASVEHRTAVPNGITQPVAIMVGAEYEGVSDEAAMLADARVRVRMSPLMDGSLDSLNVNVAASIVLEHVFHAMNNGAPAQ